MPVMKELTLLFSKGIGGFSKDTVGLSRIYISLNSFSRSFVL